MNRIVVKEIKAHDNKIKDGMGREVGGEFRIGNTCTLVADSCCCIAKPIQYCKVKKKRLKI